MTAVNLNRAVRGPVTAVPVVAGHGVRIVPDTVNNRFVVEADETVLFEDSNGAADSVALSETLNNFEYVKIVWKDWDTNYCIHVKEFRTDSPNFMLTDTWGGSSNTIDLWSIRYQPNETKTSLTKTWGRDVALSDAKNTYSAANGRIMKVIGINRISST